MYNTKVEPWEPNLTSLVRFETKWKNDLPQGTTIPTKVNNETKKLKIGVFEGGGYLTKGMYRPAYDCRMRTNEAPAFLCGLRKSGRKNDFIFDRRIKCLSHLRIINHRVKIKCLKYSEISIVLFIVTTQHPNKFDNN